jgi:hypothetical protein
VTVLRTAGGISSGPVDQILDQSSGMRNIPDVNDNAVLSGTARLLSAPAVHVL